MKRIVSFVMAARYGFKSGRLRPAQSPALPPPARLPPLLPLQQLPTTARF